MSKEKFKTFAKLHPELADAVVANKVSWQHLYELYDIYGESSTVWDAYFKTQSSSIKDLFNTFRSLDMETVQKGVNNLQKTLGLIQDLGFTKESSQTTYEPRPIYRRFDD